MKIKILVINNEGEGNADFHEVESGTNVMQLVQSVAKNPSSCLIRVNREQVSGDYVLQQKDRVTITPKNIEGA